MALLLPANATVGPLWTVNVSCQMTSKEIPSYCPELLELCSSNESRSAGFGCSVKSGPIVHLFISQVLIRLSINRVAALSEPLDLQLHPTVSKEVLSILAAIPRRMSLGVWRRGQGRSFVRVSDDIVVNYSIALGSWMRLSCDTFDRPGVYDLRIRSVDGLGSVVADRLAMNASLIVHPWKGYNMLMRSDRLFPCDGIGISINTVVPNCSSDRVQHQLRLLAIRRQQSLMEIRRHGLYMAEKKLRPGVSVTHFDCNHFDLIYPEYCFQLVSTYKDGFVESQAQRCIPTELKTRMPVHGKWSIWTPWGPCSSGCSSVRHRFRFCDSPAPQYGGHFCDGAGLQTVACNVSTGCAGKGEPTARSDEGLCKCGGCTLTSPGSVLVLSRQCVNSGYWLVVTNDNSTVIRWYVEALRLDVPAERLLIRDGREAESPILFDSAKLEQARGLVTTTGPWSKLELLIHHDYSMVNENQVQQKSAAGLTSPTVLRYSFIDKSASLSPGKSSWQETVLRISVTAFVSTAAFLATAVCLSVFMRNKWNSYLRDINTAAVAAAKYPVKSIAQRAGLMQASTCQEALLASKDDGFSSFASIPVDMYASTRTQVTQVSAGSEHVLGGIEEEEDASEARQSKRTCESESQGTFKGSSATVRRDDSASQVSFAEIEQEFEYDYYDAPVVGSILNPLQPWDGMDVDFLEE